MIKNAKVLGILVAIWILVSITSAATTFYFLPDTASGVVPNAKQSGDTINRDVASVNATYAAPGLMSQTAGSVGSASATTAAEPGANHYTHYGSWVSEPLAAQTISGTVTLGLVMSEGNTNTNATPRIMIYQWYANDTKGGNLLALTNDGVEIETAYPASPTTYFSGKSLSSVTFAAGDRLVIEIESFDASTRTNSYLHGMRFGGADGGGYGSFITFSQTINEQEFAPVTDFSANQTSGTEPMSILFTDSSTNTPTNWDWYYDNGTKFSDSQNPVQEFTEGTYTIKLYASNGGGGDWENKTNYITVSDGGPVAAFSANNTTPVVGQEILLTDSSTNTPTNWDWYYGNGTKFSDLQNPELAFGAEGLYTINLYASNGYGGDWENKTNYINVGAAGSAPVSGFSANQTSGTEPLSVAFTDSSTNSPTGWNWTYKNATVGWTLFSTSQNPTYNFPVGTYDINLSASNAFGSDDEVKVSYITVSEAGSAPVSGFSANQTSGTAPLHVLFTDSSTNSPTGWNWTYKNATVGWTLFSTSQNPTYIFPVGTYDINLSASNSFGTDDEVKVSYITVSAGGSDPVAAFSADDTNPVVDQTVTFTDSSTNTPTNWDWYYGNGTKFSDAQNPSTSFSSAGTYTINLYVSNAFGSDWENKTNYITVSEGGSSAPVAAFSADHTAVCTMDPVQFTDLSTNSPSTWYWDFGDTGTNTTKNPIYRYSTNGIFTVKLRATNAFGFDWENKTNYIGVGEWGACVDEGETCVA